MGHVSNSQVIFKTVGVALDEAVPDSFSAGAERMIYMQVFQLGFMRRNYLCLHHNLLL